MTDKNLIREVRHGNGMTQKEFAEAMGFSSDIRISEFESGRNPINKQLKIILVLLKRKKITMQDILKSRSKTF